MAFCVAAKLRPMNRRLFLAGLLSSALLCSIACAQTEAVPTPKKLLVVSTTAGYRHGSIEIAEKALQEMAARDGSWTLDSLHQPADGDLTKALEPLAPGALAPYDGVIFLSTSGELPLPDRDGFLNWIAQGKAFIGIHSATDTFHKWPAYQQMLGGEFEHHGAQTGATIRVANPAHPATEGLGAEWKLEREEIYEFKNYDREKVDELLVLDRNPTDGTPGHFPLAWTKSYHKGRVFYSALGHREDLWTDDSALQDRVNVPAVAPQFLAHLHGGIAWALGLTE